ncbi:uncharacterized protein BCR38DRAFT_507941 [Pseudomassariella vexata]|uniref:Uncharacterized protein n=1 Tax=Pseudomassariella vexata TaxID=1141098 RepID=A0A1Y2EB11_9PEZI|nr:uncharacterized protein BCR38DRAFT_507941 [Pseudomassariella vexata]ORY68752.1 hypothetical protein BCR38DRAFT_507941 [Pseudomassariella vexata]
MSYSNSPRFSCRDDEQWIMSRISKNGANRRSCVYGLLSTRLDIKTNMNLVDLRTKLSFLASHYSTFVCAFLGVIFLSPDYTTAIMKIYLNFAYISVVFIHLLSLSLGDLSNQKRVAGNGETNRREPHTRQEQFPDARAWTSCQADPTCPANMAHPRRTFGSHNHHLEKRNAIEKSDIDEAMGKLEKSREDFRSAADQAYLHMIDARLLLQSVSMVIEINDTRTITPTSTPVAISQDDTASWAGTTSRGTADTTDFFITPTEGTFDDSSQALPSSSTSSPSYFPQTRTSSSTSTTRYSTITEADGDLTLVPITPSSSPTSSTASSSPYTSTKAYTNSRMFSSYSFMPSASSNTQDVVSMTTSTTTIRSTTTLTTTITVPSPESSGDPDYILDDECGPDDNSATPNTAARSGTVTSLIIIMGTSSSTPSPANIAYTYTTQMGFIQPSSGLSGNGWPSRSMTYSHSLTYRFPTPNFPLPTSARLRSSSDSYSSSSTPLGGSAMMGTSPTSSFAAKTTRSSSSTRNTTTTETVRLPGSHHPSSGPRSMKATRSFGGAAWSLPVPSDTPWGKSTAAATETLCGTGHTPLSTHSHSHGSTSSTFRSSFSSSAHSTPCSSTGRSSTYSSSSSSSTSKSLLPTGSFVLSTTFTTTTTTTMTTGTAAFSTMTSSLTGSSGSTSS